MLTLAEYTTSAAQNLGPHLLGAPAELRPLDVRDYQMAEFLGLDDPLEGAFAALLKSRTSKATKAWASAAMDRLRILEPPVPMPEPSPEARVNTWQNLIQLDQGQTGHCVGFTGGGWGITAPVEDKLGDADGHAIYYECKVQDGQPGKENGSSIHSLGKVLVARGRLDAYVWSRDPEEIFEWILTKGPVCFGIDWYNDMFDPDSQGYVELTGGVAGGHAVTGRGVDMSASSADDHTIQIKN
jgi:hypothetical protein